MEPDWLREYVFLIRAVRQYPKSSEKKLRFQDILHLVLYLAHCMSLRKKRRDCILSMDILSLMIMVNFENTIQEH